jgi:hypothetical protein
MALLAPQSVALPSLLPTFTAAAGGGDTANGGAGRFLVVKNGGGAPITVTLAVPGNDDFGNARPDLGVTVANATERYIPLNRAEFGSPVSITYSAVTSVTVAVIQV